jgi:hypothetical protein
MSDATSRVDGVRYRRYHRQQFGWRLEALRWVFLKQHLEQKNDRLRNTFELVDR